MYSSFKDTFIRKPQFTVQTPEAVLRTIGKELPEGFRYVDDHDGFCRIDCDGSMDIVPSNVKLPEKAIPIFSKLGKFTMREVMAYAYNTQQNIELVPDAEDCYLVNGQKIKCRDFVVSPLKGTQLKEGRMFVIPPPFPTPHPIEVSGNGYCLTLMVQRQTVNSIYEVKFASIDDSAALSVSYSFDSSKENGTMQFNIQTRESSSAADVLASKEIFNAFIEGSGHLGEIPISPNENNADKKVSDDTLRFWHRIVDVENALGIKFDTSQEITFDDIKTIDIMHRCFVERKPFKTYLKDGTLRGNGEFNQILLDNIDSPIGKPILFEYVEAATAQLLGVTINCFVLTVMFGGIVSEIELPEDRASGNFFIKLLPPENGKMFSSTRYFLSEEELENVKAESTHMEEFEKAEELDKY